MNGDGHKALGELLKRKPSRGAVAFLPGGVLSYIVGFVGKVEPNHDKPNPLNFFV